jgi:hypothetical protein
MVLNNRPEHPGITPSLFESLSAVQLQEDQHISLLDPLKADRFFRETFVVLAAQKQPDQFIEAIWPLINEALQLPQFTRLEALAALRDLGMIAAVVTRYGIPVPDLPDLEQALARLGKLGGEVPRETLFSYTTRNPEGTRLRTFTNLTEERLFIDTLREGLLSTIVCLRATFQACLYEPYDPAFVQSLEMAAEAFSELVPGIVEIRKKISPELFTFQMRPFFDPFEVNGVSYLAPSGTQLPLILIDWLVWGRVLDEEEQWTYASQQLPYLPSCYSELATALLNRPGR